MKQLRKERDVALFSLRKYEDGPNPSKGGRDRTPNKDRAKSPGRERSKTPTKGKGKSRKDEDEGWTRQPGSLPRKTVAEVDDKKQPSSGFEVNCNTPPICYVI